MLVGGDTERESFGSILGGAGFVQPVGGRTSMFVTAMYNFSYDEDDLFSPYSDPWVIRVGVTVGF